MESVFQEGPMRCMPPSPPCDPWVPSTASTASTCCARASVARASPRPHDLQHISSLGDRLRQVMVQLNTAAAKAHADNGPQSLRSFSTRGEAHGAVASKGQPDMIMMSQLTEDAIVQNLKDRHRCNIVYTYISDIVISLNPFKKVFGDSAVGEQQIARYRGAPANAELPPHVYALVNRAFAEMQRAPAGSIDRRQEIIISGESGAGKTHTTKICLEFLKGAVAGAGSAERSAMAFMKASPVFEALGNAKTVRNDNSSRFGKHLDVQFSEELAIIGAKTTTCVN